MYSNNLKLINKFYIIKDLNLIIKTKTKKNNIALIINVKQTDCSKKIKNFIKKNIHNKIFVANNPKLITNKKITGLYMSAYNNKTFSFNKNYLFNYTIIGAAHNITDIRKKFLIGCDIVFLSPIFKTTSHPNAKPVGLIKFLLISKMFQNKVYPLGGVNEKKLGYFNKYSKFAGISCFK